MTLDLQAFNLASQHCNILVIISFCTCVGHTARTMISKTKMLMLRKTRPALQCHFSSPPAVHHPEKPRNSNKDSKMEDWVPHPRTGIFVPKGREWVMDDVPEKAASLNQTYWLRNVDGVEKPDPDNPDTVPPHHPCLSTNL